MLEMENFIYMAAKRPKPPNCYLLSSLPLRLSTIPLVYNAQAVADPQRRNEVQLLLSSPGKALELTLGKGGGVLPEPIIIIVLQISESSRGKKIQVDSSLPYHFLKSRRICLSLELLLVFEANCICSFCVGLSTYISFGEVVFEIQGVGKLYLSLLLKFWAIVLKLMRMA
ncbi:hypothetical protein L3X38_027015 [Prunus dulcis]|uniref:Uncharacterized protein n=1 Tax=Prunus dulcis TaxID=3755 RepID=A0AAD4VNL0_PRUDU|nr:hypothetical protein L3X38_027015 [Prunus dulcis]